MKHLLQLLLLCLCCSSLTVISYAQASSSTAELRGTVTDNSGAVIPNAKITLTDLAKGAVRTGTSDSEGNYTFVGLLPSLYELKVEAPNFAASLNKFELTIGQQATLPVKLNTGGVSAQVDVVAGAEVVEVARAEQSSLVDKTQIVNLPIGRRNFLDYALLTPGVVDSDNIADASDYRVAQTPQSGLSFGGNNGRGNMVQVDGVAVLNSSGGVTATVSQEGVQEFQVIRNSYNAEFGGASGGIVNILTKSGGNVSHGSIFGLFRNRKLDARNAFDFNPNGQSPFSRQQWGFSIGGAPKQDKTFYFVALEQLKQKRTSFVNLLQDPAIFQPSASQNSLIQLLSAAPVPAVAGLAPVLRGALTTTEAAFPRTVKLFRDASGQFPFDSSNTQFSTRFDHNFSDRSTGYVRLFTDKGRYENQAAGALTAVSRGRELDTFTGGVMASHNYQASSTAFNEFKALGFYLRYTNTPNDKIGPELNIEGYGNFGRDIFLPAQSIERHYDIYDNFTKLAGNHTFKFGGSAMFLDVSSNSETFFGGRFNFGAAFPLATVLGLDPRVGPAGVQALTAYVQQANPALLPALSAPLNALQSFNLGLPTVYQQGFGDTAADSWTNRYSFYAQDSWKLASNFTLNYGLRYSLFDEPFFVPTYKKDWQPRVSFSWDPAKDGKTVIRGGAGTFVGFLNNAVANVTTELSGFNDPSTIFIVLATPTTNNFGLPRSFDVYQQLAALTNNFSRTITRADLGNVLAPASAVPAGVPRRPITPGPDSPLEVRFRLGNNYRNPVSYQASLGVQRDLGKGFSLDASYLWVRGLHITRNRDANQFKATGPVNPLNPLGGPTFIRFPSAAQAAAGLTSDFRNPLRLQDNLYEMTANSFYNAATVQLQKRFSGNFSLNTHYTLSKAIDEVTDFNSDFSAQSPINVRADRSLSAFHQTHRFVASGVLTSTANHFFLKDWVVAPIFRAESGRPFNLLLGFDANGDGRTQSDRPGAAGRNTGRGQAFYSTDFRLARRFLAKESRYLEFTFEAFNLTNRVNFQGINNIIGGTFATATNYIVSGDKTKKPTEPLGFTSAADARQLQLGFRFNF